MPLVPLHLSLPRLWEPFQLPPFGGRSTRSREAGLLTEGPGWTLRVASAFPVAERVRKQISLDLDSDKEAQR